MVVFFWSCIFFWCGQVSYLAADGLFPEWKIWAQFLNESTEGLKLDGLAESHPIEVMFSFSFSWVPFASDKGFGSFFPIWNFMQINLLYNVILYTIGYIISIVCKKFILLG